MMISKNKLPWKNTIVAIGDQSIVDDDGPLTMFLVVMVDIGEVYTSS